jgi:hypothetical protein
MKESNTTKTIPKSISAHNLMQSCDTKTDKDINPTQKQKVEQSVEQHMSKNSIHDN